MDNPNDPSAPVDQTNSINPQGQSPMGQNLNQQNVGAGMDPNQVQGQYAGQQTQPPVQPTQPMGNPAMQQPPVQPTGNPASQQPQGEPKDQNVYNFLIQIIQEKHGNNLPWDQITLEADGLYEKLGDQLVNTFEPEMSEEHKKDFDGLVAQGYKQEDLQMYLLQNIPNLEQRIQQILLDFRNNYLNS